MRRTLLFSPLLLAAAWWPLSADAGGLEIPDNGTEALGRGAAFTAKADDGTALEYNLAGLAEQRGTRLLADANLWFSNYSFQRTGKYPDDPSNPITPWGGKPFPKVSDRGGPFFAPFIAGSTDFGYFKRWTFALGVFGPSAVGNRTYPYSLGYAPNPARYDIVQNRPLVAYPTLAVAVKALPWLDIGLAVHVVFASIDIQTTSLADAIGRGTGAGQCANAEYQPCDARTELQTLGASATGGLGLLIRPKPFIAFGVNVRGPAAVHTSGHVNPQTPRITPNAGFETSPASFDFRLPVVLRGGVRYIFLDGEREAGDVELDATYEGWTWAWGKGPGVTIPTLKAKMPPPGVDLTNVDFVSPHGYHDSWSLRLGGAFNIPLGHKVEGKYDYALPIRAGAYYDAASSDLNLTRLDFDTLAKAAGTLGIGVELPGVTFNVGYAEIFDVSRTVTNGTLRPVNGGLHGTSNDPSGMPYPAVNDGTYSGHSHLLSLGLEMRFDTLFRKAKPAEPSNAAPLPTTESPTNESPKTDTPKTDAPKTDAPQAEPPKAPPPPPAQ